MSINRIKDLCFRSYQHGLYDTWESTFKEWLKKELKEGD